MQMSQMFSHSEKKSVAVKLTIDQFICVNSFCVCVVFPCMTIWMCQNFLVFYSSNGRT